MPRSSKGTLYRLTTTFACRGLIEDHFNLRYIDDMCPIFKWMMFKTIGDIIKTFRRNVSTLIERNLYLWRL